MLQILAVAAVGAFVYAVVKIPAFRRKVIGLLTRVGDLLS